MPRLVPAPCDPAEMRRFLDTFLYTEPAFLVDEVLRLDPGAREVEARMDSTRDLPIAKLQRTDDGKHPPHVSGAMIMVTGNLGCLHAWFFHGCRWDEGWAGFGNRIHRADFKQLARIGPPVHLHSKETRTRVGPKRVVLRYEFTFTQEEKVVYWGDQSAIFVREGFKEES